MEILPVRYLDALPLPLAFILTVGLLLLFSEAGFRLGRRWKTQAKEESPQTGAIMGATLGLLAFMLAFTFGMASSRFDARKAVVVEEANAIGTAWLRSQMMPEAHPEKLEPLFLRYVEIRLEAVQQARNAQHFAELIAESVDIQNALWSHALVLGREHPRSVVAGLYIDALNAMIDLQETRLNVVRYRIPRGVMATLYFIAFIASTLVGVNAGQSGSRSLLVTLLLAITLAVVISLIIDLDRPGQALFQVNQQALVDLRESIVSSQSSESS